MESIESLASAVREHRDLTHETASKAADALYLLGLIERHRWCVEPVESNILPPGSWAVESDACNGEMAHVEPTLTEALNAASRCSRCVGGE